MNVRRSFALASLDNYVNQFLILGTTVVMARVLTPSEIGLFLIVLSVIMIGDNFRDFGVTPFIMQATDLDAVLLRTAFTVTFLLSLAIFASIVLGADRIAGFYGEPLLSGLLTTASLAFLLVPFTSPITALMRREMQFGNIAKINIGVGVVNCIATISLGLAGFGASSYVLGYLMSKIANIVIVIALRPDFWIYRPCLVGARKVFAFGSASAGVVIINLVHEQLPKLAIGKIIGFDALGLFSRAVTICQLPERFVVAGLQPVILPALAAHARAGGDLKTEYLRGVSLMSAFQWPALVMLALLADPVVDILLGPQWQAGPPLVRIMALALMALAPAFMTYPLLVSAGHIRAALLASLI
ncbi:MAG: oligosaccharide flippase family protein, partial [Paracoccaceae bacterium]